MRWCCQNFKKDILLAEKKDTLLTKIYYLHRHTSKTNFNKNFLYIKQWELPAFRPAFFITTFKKYIITQCVSKVTFYIFNHWDLPVVLSPFC